MYVNDYEEYAYIVNKTYLPDRSEQLNNEIKIWINKANNIKNKGNGGFISEKYAPKDDYNIKQNERVFYTSYNAKIIDNIRNFIEKEVPEHIKVFILGALLQKASVHNNTSGVFKGFHKKNGIGHFGGVGENALTRIKGEIQLEMPVYYNTGCEIIVKKGDTNQIIKTLDNKIDIAYFDPPYNQHPYGSNYGILNIIANNGGEIQEEGVSGIPKNWYKSEWNKKQNAIIALEELIKNTNAKYIIFSYNNEGLIDIEKFQEILEKYGKVTIKKEKYNTYKGSRNLKGRSKHVSELLWILKKN